MGVVWAFTVCGVPLDAETCSFAAVRKGEISIGSNWIHGTHVMKVAL